MHFATKTSRLFLEGRGDGAACILSRRRAASTPSLRGGGVVRVAFRHEDEPPPPFLEGRGGGAACISPRRRAATKISPRGALEQTRKRWGGGGWSPGAGESIFPRKTAVQWHCKVRNISRIPPHRPTLPAFLALLTSCTRRDAVRRAHSVAKFSGKVTAPKHMRQELSVSPAASASAIAPTTS